MLERDPRRLAAWAVAALVLALLAAWYLSRSRPTADASPPPVATISVHASTASAAVVVDVAGAVHKPGVYRLTTANRVEDALKRAGGATPHADLSQINRAAKLEDGRQILVPRRAARAASGAAPAPAAAPPPPRHGSGHAGAARESQHRHARAARHARRRRPDDRAEDHRLPHR